ncbi:asparagine synthase C-terminal domain-containing protein [Brevundimonas sp.]|uniref:asparagine synthase C-terminal domain-containing protein n=1 Tax=Brevundimonas sp. TaxID=1871086 RepID=UPI002898C387|nr:asparagine synthase C-terminal domain-containing protein [Brevundimonas sp.]
MRRAAIEAGCQVVESSQTSWVGTMGPNAPGAYSPRSGALVIGEVWTHPDASVDTAHRAADLEYSRWHCGNRWGRFVILYRDADGKVRAVFRDPSGSLAAFVWSARGVQIVASATPDWLVDGSADGLSIDWDEVASWHQSPLLGLRRSPLVGLVSARPGEHLDLETGGQQLWSLDETARRPSYDRRTAPRILKHRLEDSVRALVGNRPVGIELSGGLDSAIVAGAIRATGKPIDFALNLRSDHPETDERAYARAAANASGVALTERLRVELDYSSWAFEETAGDPIPSQNGRDLVNDCAVTEACAEAGVERLITGKGGDALFFQMHTPLAFADLAWRRPLGAMVSAHLPGVARWTRTSTWSLLQRALETRRVAEPDSLPPAKRLQIAAIESGLAYYSACRRADRVDLIHPLMTQPMIEWALRTPVDLLVNGGRERGLARAVFADHIPPEIGARQGKGDYAAYFNQQAARNLAFLRDYLLGGRLAAEGILDTNVMDAQLTEDGLRWRGGASEVLAAVSLEAWVRRWERRLATA